MVEKSPDSGNDVNFFQLGLKPYLASALAHDGRQKPTPIQAQVIPEAMKGKNILGIAQTGTGKTLGYGAPMLQRIKDYGGRGLVVVPTRELAIQVKNELFVAAREVHVEIVALIGGIPISIQQTIIGSRNPRVYVATPGRLLEHFKKNTLKVDEIRILILDEVDRLLDMGFLPDIKRMMDQIPQGRQTMMFSATIPKEVDQLIASHLKDPVRIEVAPPNTTAHKVEQQLLVVEHKKKFEMLQKLVTEHLGQIIVFTNQKNRADNLANGLRQDGHSAAEFHKDCEQRYRKNVMQEFRDGKIRILVGTDVLSRGIDVPDVSLVVNYDLPNILEDYVHRIGRTGRAGREGKAISFATPIEEVEGVIKKIEDIINKPIPRMEQKLHSAEDVPASEQGITESSAMTQENGIDSESEER
jgi:ATP-dependent RNA helicase RhlE